jgi:2-succinyl-5-enolpyruvyl-6-hydroxy-3-cyclohexene-1-carboxylate synthase
MGKIMAITSLQRSTSFPEVTFQKFMAEGSEGGEAEPLHHGNFIIRLQDILDRLTDLLQRMRAQSDDQARQLKKEYKEDSHLSSRYQRRLGNGAPLFAGLSTVVVAAAFTWPRTKEAQEFYSAIGAQCVDGIKNLVNGHTQASKEEVQAKLNLDSTELQDLSQQKSAQSNLDALIGEIYRALSQLLARASA